jgi:hypothetical protein
MSGESRPTLIEVWNDVEYAAGGTRRSVSSVAWQGVEERSVEPNQPARLQFRAPAQRRGVRVPGPGPRAAPGAGR